MLEKQIVDTSPIKALVNSGIGYALAPVAQAIYDYTKGALDISKNPTKASNYLLMLPAKAPLKRGVAIRMMLILQKIQYIICIKQLLKSTLEYCLIYQLVQAPEAYTGFQKAAKGNDMIDAYLYNKTINPSYGVKKINVDYGPHENYIR